MRNIRSPQWVWPVGTGVVAFAVYAVTTCPTVYPGDNGELATAAALLEIAHPPGYPLLMCLGRITVLIGGLLSPIFALNLMTAACGAAAVALLCQCQTSLEQRSLLANRFVAASTVLIFGFGATAWSVSTHFEVHALSIFLMAAMFLATMVAVGTSSIRHLILADFLLGLSLCNHLSTAALLPLLVATHWSLRRNHSPRILLLMLSALLVPLFLYLYLPLRGPAAEVLTWNGLDSFTKVRDHVTAASYRQYLDAPGLADLLPFTRLLLVRFIGDWVFLAAPLAVIGWITLWQRLRVLAIGLVLSIGLNLWLAFVYTIPDIESYLLPSLLISALLLGVFLNALVTRARNLRYAIPSIAVAAAVAVCFVNYSRCDLSSRAITAEYGSDLLRATPPQSILLCASDYTGFPALYLRYVEKLRPDVEVFGKLPTNARLQKRLDFFRPTSFSDIARADELITTRLARPLVFAREPMAIVDDQFLANDDFISSGLLTSRIPLAVSSLDWSTRVREYLRREYFDPKEAATAIGVMLLAAEQESANAPELADRLRKGVVDIAVSIDNHALTNELAAYLTRINALSAVRRLLETSVQSPTLRARQTRRLRAQLGSVYFDLGDLNRAESVFAQMIESSPTDSHARYHVLAIQAARRRSSGANSELASLYRQMLDIYPHQHEIAFRLALTQLALSDTSQARRLLENCRAAGYRSATVDSLLATLLAAP